MARIAPRLPVPKKKHRTFKPAKYEQEVVACLNDYHGNAAWGKDKTDGKTEWNFSMFCSTLQYHVDKIVEFTLDDRAKYGLKTLHLDVLGDMWHGRLRVEDQVSNEFPTAPGMLCTAWVMFQAILQLAEHFDTIEVRCMAGNHGRIDKKPEAGRYVEESYETIIYGIIKSLIYEHGLSLRIKVAIPNTEVYTFVRLGHTIKIGHGGHIKGGNSIAGIPIYGLSREILRQFRNEMVSGSSQGISLITYGHFHDYSVLKNTMLISGAGCPTGPWALHRFGEFADPTNLIYYTSEKWAIGWSLPISLKHGWHSGHDYSYDPEMFLSNRYVDLARC